MLLLAFKTLKKVKLTLCILLALTVGKGKDLHQGVFFRVLAVQMVLNKNGDPGREPAQEDYLK